MKKTIAFLLGLLVLPAQAGALGIRKRMPESLQVKELKLKNGMTVWLNEDHSQPKVYGAVVVRAGAKDCPGTGIAHYFEHIMFKGTDRIGTVDYAAERPWLDSISAQYDLLSQTRDEAGRAAIQKHINELSLKAADYAIPNEFNRLISRYGGSGLNAATGMDVTYYHNTFMPQYIRQWCWLNSERLLHPVFRLFQAELENVYEEKNRSADDMGDALDKVLQVIFKDQPYGQPIIGTTESLKNPRLSDMDAFYRKYYVASNMGLLLCGDIDADSLEPLLEETFGRVQTGPVPERAVSSMPAITKNAQVGIKLPIPLIKIIAHIQTAPTDFDPDADILDLANGLLTNGKAGLLDSLMNEHVLMAGIAARTAFNDAGIQLLVAVPKLPFGKKQKAINACLRQVERVKRGEFSDERVEELKQEMLQEAETAIETIDERAAVMLDAFSQGHSWNEVIKKIENIRAITRDDIVRVANKYYTDDFITFVKRFGVSGKETLKQPGYKPVEPKNAGGKSDFARELEQMPVSQEKVRVVDMQNDVERLELTPHVKLYAKSNPMNDVFSFTLRYLDGSLEHQPMLKHLASYLDQLGTDSLKKQQLEAAWLHLGVTMEIEAGTGEFKFTLTGRDAQLQPALHLLRHFMRRAKTDENALKEIRQGVKVDYKGFGKQKDDVLAPMLRYAMFGKRSPNLRQMSVKEVKAMTSQDLMALFDEVQSYECELEYCGQLPAGEVAALAQSELRLERCSKPWGIWYDKMQEPTENIVYFYHVPKSRQNLVATYEMLRPAPTWAERVLAKTWSNYMGGGMSSVLFQNVREFRSLAYSTGGSLRQPGFVRHGQDPLAYITATGTQADKTRQVMHIVDSLLHQMPMEEENMEAARQEIINDVQNTYPSFRGMTGYVASHYRNGFTEAPERYYAELAPKVTSLQVEQFHREQVSRNKRVWIVIGDRKQTDFKELGKYGKVVELKKSDIYR